jgi:hypothetical protein
MIGFAALYTILQKPALRASANYSGSPSLFDFRIELACGLIG